MTYNIKSGDTLSKIGKRYGVSVSALASLNKIKDPDKIKAGQTILIPTAEPDIKTLVQKAVEDVENLPSVQELLRIIEGGEGVRENDFMRAVRANIARVNRYETGGDGSGGGCDCIGLIIGAVRLMGETWTGIHGSNYAARNHTAGLAALTDAAALDVGNLVYKAKEPDELNYKLPSRYANDHDQRDYYHVGIVTAVNPLEITHCTAVKGGIKRDAALGGWNYFGELIL